MFKRDLLDESGRLDSTRRLGGWGALSKDLQRWLDGTWTARSHRPVAGLGEMTVPAPTMTDPRADRLATLLLYSQEGATRLWITASIDGSGALTVQGQDFGEAPEQFFGRDEYEYLTSVAATDIQQLRLALTEQLGERATIGPDVTTLELDAVLSGRHDAVTAFAEICRDKDIPHAWFAWP